MNARASHATRRKPGRPPFEVNAKRLAAIGKLAGLGLSEREIAYCIGCAPNTFGALKTRDPRVSASLEKGMATANEKVSSTLYRLALKGNLGAIVWYEKTRCGRHETRAEFRDERADQMTAIEQLLSASDDRRSGAGALVAAQ